mgnify:FL=1|tara:strand:+ start:6669 stop:7544 length:876 start_codon:yes stop_codon:yes gene_type:complete
MTITKAVIPVAGLGTRFLPATLAVSKVMIPIVDRPSIHYAIEELHQAGITEVIFIISPDQKSIKDYFQPRPDIEILLQNRGETELLKNIRSIQNLVSINFVTQKSPLGLGHAILQSKKLIGDQPFAVLLPDDLIFGNESTTSEMIKIFYQNPGIILAAKKVKDEMISKLGIIDPLNINGNQIHVKSVIEKPDLENAPSNIAIIGRYILPKEIFAKLESIQPGALGEIQLTDAIDSLMTELPCVAYQFTSDHFDIGTPVGLVKASVYQSLTREHMSEDVSSWIKTIPLLNED